jgi:hypothetical protein
MENIQRYNKLNKILFKEEIPKYPYNLINNDNQAFLLNEELNRNYINDFNSCLKKGANDEIKNKEKKYVKNIICYEYK